MRSSAASEAAIDAVDVAVDAARTVFRAKAAAYVPLHITSLLLLVKNIFGLMENYYF